MKTIFVVDDDQEQAELMAQALSSRTTRVRAFSDPIRALAALQNDGTDLLIADLAMPWLDGGDMIASARVKRPGLKIFLVSGYLHGADIARQHNIPFFLKPVDMSELRAAAAVALNGG